MEGPLAAQQRALSPSSRLQGHRRQLHRSQYQPKQAPLAQIPRCLHSVYLMMTAPAGKLNRVRHRVLDRGTQGSAGTLSAQHKPVTPSWLMSAACRLGGSVHQWAVECGSALRGMMQLQLAEVPGEPQWSSNPADANTSAKLDTGPARLRYESWHAETQLSLTSNSMACICTYALATCSMV